LTTFDELGLAAPINRALTEERYVTPTPIQAQTIPYVMGARDVIGIAQTGTGKTAAFALPILHHLSQNPAQREKKSCRVLVLSPTRELSGQIVDSFRTYGRHLQMADRMLDMGFIQDIRKIVAKLPKERQTLFFSATMPQAISDLAAHMLRDPARVAVTPVATTAEKIDQRIIHVDRAGKAALLADLLRSEPIDRALVFTRTKHGADKVVRNLGKSGIAAQAIHGNKSQNQRERALADFRKGSVRTLVATDIAARGIDVDGISHVFNYDLPNVPESYVHRIGRTARAGAEGIAISFCDAEERAYLRDIEKLIRMSIPASGREQRPQGTRAPEARPHRQNQSRQDQPRQDRPKQHQGKGRHKPRGEQQARSDNHQHQRNEHSRQENKHRRGNSRPDNHQRPAEQPNRHIPHYGDIAGVAFLNAGQKS
jgi:ATP-dependent RNA helicase RhlE